MTLFHVPIQRIAPIEKHTVDGEKVNWLETKHISKSAEHIQSHYSSTIATVAVSLENI